MRMIGSRGKLREIERRGTSCIHSGIWCDPSISSRRSLASHQSAFRAHVALETPSFAFDKDRAAAIVMLCWRNLKLRMTCI